MPRLTSGGLGRLWDFDIHGTINQECRGACQVIHSDERLARNTDENSKYEINTLLPVHPFWRTAPLFARVGL